MRRILSLLMLCAFLVGSLPLPAAQAEDVQDNDFTYAVQSDDTVMITGYTGTSTEIAIPSEIEGKPVTAIGSYVFDFVQLNKPGQPKLKSVTIPPSVTQIGYFAFAHNELTAIEIPSVTHLGRGAFQYNQLQSIELREVTFLDEYAFANNRLVSVTIPDSLGTIGRYAFQNNLLSSVSLSEGLKIIDSYAFNGNQLTTLQIPKSVTAINSNAFTNNSLGNVAIPPEVDLGSGDIDPVFDSNAILYSPMSSVKVFNHTWKKGIQFIPCKNDITYDGNGSTGGTPPSVTNYVCYNQTFAVPDQGSLTKDGYTFKGWNTKPDGSGTNYFGGNYPIIYGLPPYAVITLYANWEAKSPHQVTFDTGGGATNPSPQTVLHGDHVAKPPTPSRTDYIFEGWYANPGDTDAWDFDNDTVTGDMTLYGKWKWDGANIASVKLTTTAEQVTSGDPLMVTVAVIDDNDQPVANAVVHLSSNLGEWTLTGKGDLSATTSSIGTLTAEWTAPEDPGSVTFTASVEGTSGIVDSKTVQIVPSESSNVLLSGLSLGSITLIPEFSGDTLNYMPAEVDNFATSIEVTATTASNLSTLTINNASVVSGSTVSLPLQTGTNLIVIVVSAADGIHAQTYLVMVRRAESVTSGDYAYSLNDDGSGIVIKRYKGTNSNVVIPKTIDGYIVTEIGTGAFANLELTSVTIPDTVTNISMNAFRNNSLTAVTLPKGLESIGDFAFAENQLAQITLPDGLTSLYSHAFENNRLNSVSIPSSVTLVDSYAFSNNNLENVMFAEDGLQRIGFGAFSDNQLSTIILPKSTTYVESKAFYNNNLTQVIMPANLMIGDNAFGGTQNGVTLIFPGDDNSGMINYATWNELPYETSDVRIEYDGNGDEHTEGQAPIDDTHYDYYSSVTIQPSGSLKRTGYTFRGWNTDKDGRGTSYEAGKSYAFKRISGSVKLYAVWESEQGESPNPSSDADLAGMTLSGGELTPRFQADVTDYTAEVGYTTSKVSLVPELSDVAATVTVNGNAAESGHAVQVNLSVGSNAIKIIVTAEDGTTKPYQITVTRASAPVVPTNPTPPANPKPPADPAPQTPEKSSVLNVIPGRPPIDVNDPDAIRTMVETLTAKFNDSRNTGVPAFPDAENHWANASIRLFARLGIVQGYEDGTFKPDAIITRGEFASMIVRLFPLPQGTAATPGFTDLGNGWARDAVLTLTSNGIISGYEDDTFRADRNITRAEMIAILARIVNLATVTQEKTVNLKDIDRTWAKEQIQLAANAGIIRGRSENVFDPNKSATRAEVLNVLLRAISLSPEIKQLLEGLD